MRIITGAAKGLRLKTLAGLNTRPTSDRVKESIFSILNGLIDFYEIETVLDIFAGTGALGLESISRGAKSAVFVDNATADLIAENIRRTKFENCKVLREDFTKALKKLSAQNLKFALIFSDPPYNKSLAQNSINLVAEMDLLNEGGLIVVEHGINENLNAPENLNCIRKITYGHTTAIDIYELKGRNL